MRGTTEERFWNKVNKTNNGCWEWTGMKDYEGYGKLHVDWNNETKRARIAFAHRYAYELLVGKIPDGLEIDHLCRNRACVNPAHLEPVTHEENMKRSPVSGWNSSVKTHCPKGHPLSGDNLYLHNGRRHCKACKVQHLREWRLKKTGGRP